MRTLITIAISFATGVAATLGFFVLWEIIDTEYKNWRRQLLREARNRPPNE